MGKYKRLKKLMEAEVEILHEQIGTLRLEVAHVAREQAKAAHPSAQKKENWADVIDIEFKRAANAAIERAKSAEHKIAPKLVLFKRVGAGSDSMFVVDSFERSQLNHLEVHYDVHRPIMPLADHLSLISFKPYATYANIGDLTKRLNNIFTRRSFKFYAEVRGV